MPEQPLPPEAERISLAEAAKLTEQFGATKSLKAIQQLVARGSLNYAKVMSPGSKRASRVVTTEEWVREYLEGSQTPAPRAPTPIERAVTYAKPMRAEPSSKSYWQEIAEQQAVEILRLQAQIAELKRRR